MIAKKSYLPLIIVLSIIIPAIVALLYLIPALNILDSETVRYLPAFNASINGLTTFILIGAFVAIKNKKIDLHRSLMFIALILSVLFLISYVTYHASAPPTKYGGEGVLKGIYYFILITHIILAAVIVPLILISLVRALNERFDKHKKIARITLPLWLYVTVTGVLVYILISPYY